MKLAYAAPGSQNGQTPPNDLASRLFNNPSFCLPGCYFCTDLDLHQDPSSKDPSGFLGLRQSWLFAARHTDARGQTTPLFRRSGVPQELDILTGAGRFALTVFGLSFALFFAQSYQLHVIPSTRSKFESFIPSIRFAASRFLSLCPRNFGGRTG
jgi:hypothetical protein